MVRPVEDHTAFGTNEMREAGGFPAVVTERTLARRLQARRSSRSRENPRARLERWTVTDVLIMAAVELGDPVALSILMKATDLSQHACRSGD
jgi:hypothetical protein